MNVYDETEFLLKKYKIRANKSLGQNFLVDDIVVNSIIEKSEIEKNDLVIEIGPGLGVLTNKLLEKTDNVIAVELDERMVDILEERFKLYSNLEIINEDILKVNLYDIIKKKKEKHNIAKVKIAANLPYYISTPIIMKLLEKRLEIDSIIVMVQKEVGDRITASAGTRDAGAITYAVEYYADANKIIKVPKESFIPNPKVESEVIKLDIRKEPKINVKDENLMFDIIQKSFTLRRKTLTNALVSYKFFSNKEDVEEMFKELGIDINIRGEKLSIEQFAKISDYISK